MDRSNTVRVWPPLVALGLGITALVAPKVVAQSTPPLIFQNGWENRSELGCTLNGLRDGTGGVTNNSWNDFGPAYPGLCSGVPVAEIVNTEKFEGNRSLQVNFEPTGSQNGPDFRIGQDFSARNEIYARWYVKYSNNWVWATSDHKVAIFGSPSYSQDVYFNVRGNSNGGAGRIAVHAIRADTVFSDRNSNMTPGVWHLAEIHIVAGTNGRIEVKLDGRLLNLTDEGPRGLSPLNVNTTSSLGYIKLDTTYNSYSYPSSLGLRMKTWFDSVAVSGSGWIGGSTGGGGGGNPTPPAPDAPSNVRVIR
jgi:hypothetical protein